MPITKKTWAAGLLSLAFAGATPVWAAEVTADTVVATVGGTEITLGHVAAAREALPDQFLQMPAADLYTGLVDQLVNQAALAQSLGDDMPVRAIRMIDNQTSAILAAQALGDALEAAITDESIQAAYDARFKDSDPETEFNAAHILVETEEEAAAIKAELETGADFAKMAEVKSTGPSGPNGGALGWFGKGMMVPEFEAAVLTLEPGQVSDPVKTQFGWHLVLLNETRLVDAPTLDEVREELVAEVEGELVEQVMTDALAKTEVVRPEVDFDPAVLADPAFLDR